MGRKRCGRVDERCIGRVALSRRGTTTHLKVDCAPHGCNRKTSTTESCRICLPYKYMYVYGIPTQKVQSIRAGPPRGGAADTHTGAARGGWPLPACGKPMRVKPHQTSLWSG